MMTTVWPALGHTVPELSEVIMPADLTPDHTRRLLIFEQAHQELAQAETVEEVIDIRNKATGLVAYAKEAKSRQLALEAKRICMFAERRLGR
jgi:hypothetical protein